MLGRLIAELAEQAAADPDSSLRDVKKSPKSKSAIPKRIGLRKELSGRC